MWSLRHGANKFFERRRSDAVHRIYIFIIIYYLKIGDFAL